MTTYKILSLDESGKASYSHASDLFILSGVIISEKFKIKLNKKIRIMKKRFFGDEEIVFHSREMYRKKGVFSIFENPKIELKFWKRFINIVSNTEIDIIFVITDKNLAKKKGWQPKTILKRSYISILEIFFENLKASTCKGKIIVESDPLQDLYLLEAHNVLQGGKMQYRKQITSLSLVNKDNFDVDVQIADALASIAGKLYTKTKLTKINEMKRKLIEDKIFGENSLSKLKILIESKKA